MKTLIDPKDQQAVLAQWRGAKADIWAFHVSLKRMAINLIRNDDQESLFILAMGCEHMSGPFRWSQANVTIITEPQNQWGEVRRRIVDSNAGFELICSDVSIARGPACPPRDPFDGFFGD